MTLGSDDPLYVEELRSSPGSGLMTLANLKYLQTPTESYETGSDTTSILW
jgi:hypothetical protein